MDEDEDETIWACKPITEIRAGAPKGFPYGFYCLVDADIGMSYERYLEIRAWCKEHLGREGFEYFLDDPRGIAWIENREGIWFRDVNHATLFKMQWL